MFCQMQIIPAERVLEKTHHGLSMVQKFCPLGIFVFCVGVLKAQSDHLVLLLPSDVFCNLQLPCLPNDQQCHCLHFQCETSPLIPEKLAGTCQQKYQKCACLWRTTLRLGFHPPIVVRATTLESQNLMILQHNTL